MWPYLYPEFKDGTIYTVDGQKFNKKLNIHVLESRLHYLDGNTIMETKSEELLLVEIGEDRFMCVNGRVMKVIGSNERGFVATLILGDFDKIFETGGAYGSSSSSSATMKLSSVEIGGKNIINHMELRKNKDGGKALSLTTFYFIVTNGNVYPANKGGIEKALSAEDQAAFKLFLKKNKINWKNPQSLMTLLDFFNK